MRRAGMCRASIVYFPGDGCAVTSADKRWRPGPGIRSAVSYPFTRARIPEVALAYFGSRVNPPDDGWACLRLRARPDREDNQPRRSYRALRRGAFVWSCSRLRADPPRLLGASEPGRHADRHTPWRPVPVPIAARLRGVGHFRAASPFGKWWRRDDHRSSGDAA